ncbi:MAG: isoleucine--tRNA ligase [Candidatus Wildermuthbacteria bacterium]|nr:isoleucine--tRNA ligase [Candidatus Wildermuthbacteria bacterium]
MNPDFPKLEEEVLEVWKKEKTFKKSIARRRAGKRFVFFEGPPTANGRPGIHHVLGRSFKDIILRYKTMRGFLVNRKGGWDTHGLPVELEVEKELGLKSKREIEQYGIAAFNKKCKESVWKYKKDWENLTERMGFWIDLKNPYITYENSYIETLWQIIKTFWEKKLLYKDYKVVAYCPRCGTPLSSHEMAQGYKTVKERSVYVKFEIPSLDSRRGGRNSKSETNTKLQIPNNTYFLAWTTTPWTLPGNVALAVHPKITYVLAQKGDEHYILAKELAQKILGEHQIVKTFLGSELVGISYTPLFPFGKPEKGKKIWEVVPANFVSVKEGTGIVHTAVAYGQDDFELGKKENLAMLHLVDERGKFKAEVVPWKGMFVKTADPLIIEDLKQKGLLFKEELYEHEYPFCWRCSTPLLYYAKEGWFVNMQKVKKEILKNNDSINWIPSHMKKGRMGEWLKELKDWAFSRERYWGTPLPIWECKRCDQTEVMGSVQELKEKAHALPRNEKDEIDLHRPYVDAVKFYCKKCSGGTMERVKDVADVWFDSGAMPFAQNHWMGGVKPKEFPADYIVEGIDQTRGWFYTLLAVSTLLGFKAPFKNVISFNHVLDAKGEKMSKSKGNVVNPWDMIQKYGIDAVRWYFYTVNNPGDPKLFAEKDIQQTMRSFFLIFWNCFVFYDTYKTAKTKLRLGTPKRSLGRNILDQWILSRLGGTTQEVTEKLDLYDVTGAARAIQDFVVNDLSLWYIRRSRSRAKEASATLRFVLSEVSKLSAPFIPFLSEHIFRSLGEKASVHLANWPKVLKASRNKKLEEEMEQARSIVAKALAERARVGIKVRQPLASLKIRNPKSEIRKEVLNLVKDEVNVKEIVFNPRLKQEVELDTKITPELREEGMLREITRAVQGMRKDAGFVPSQKIALRYQGDPELMDLLLKYKAALQKQLNIRDMEQGILEGQNKKQLILEEKSLWLFITEQKQSS